MEAMEGCRLVNLPLLIQVSFTAFQVGATGSNRNHGFAMDCGSVPMFPAPVKQTTMLCHVIDCINGATRAKTLLSGLTHFDAPLSPVGSSSPLFDGGEWLVCIDRIHMSNVATRGRLKRSELMHAVGALRFFGEEDGILEPCSLQTRGRVSGLLAWTLCWNPFRQSIAMTCHR